VGLMRAAEKTPRAALGCALALVTGLAAAPASSAECWNLAGKYLFDVEDGPLKATIEKQLGGVYKRFDERYQTQVPFETTGDGYVYASGCMAHNCSVDEAFLGVEEKSCRVFVALLENEKFTLLIPGVWPAALDKARRDWVNRH